MICFHTQKQHFYVTRLISVENTIESVKKALSNDFGIIEIQFHENLMVLNAKKYHYLCFGIGSENDDFVFVGIKLPNSCEEKILGVIKLIMSLNLIHILGVCVKKQRKNLEC